MSQHSSVVWLSIRMSSDECRVPRHSSVENRVAEHSNVECLANFTKIIWTDMHEQDQTPQNGSTLFATHPS